MPRAVSPQPAFRCVQPERVTVARPWALAGAWAVPGVAAAAPLAKPGPAVPGVAETTPTPSEASTAASKAADASPGNQSQKTSSPITVLNERVHLSDGVQRFGPCAAVDMPALPLQCSPDTGSTAFDNLEVPSSSQPLGQHYAYPLSGHERGDALVTEDGSPTRGTKPSMSAAEVAALFQDPEEQVGSPTQQFSGRQWLDVPGLAAPEDQAGWAGTSPEEPRLRYAPFTVPGPSLEDSMEASPYLSTELDAWPGNSRGTSATLSGMEKARMFHFQVGDRVLVDGRLGVISWNGLPEHKFAAVRWDDDDQESEPLPLAEMCKVEDSPTFSMNHSALKAGVEASRGLPLLC